MEVKISEIVNRFLDSEEYATYYLVEVKSNKHSKKIEIFVDGDEGISFGMCRKVSRAVEAHLDEINYNEGKYTLDVSSPGLANPLKMHRQYVKNIGRDIKVVMEDNEEIKGMLKEVTAEYIVVYTSKMVRLKKKKKKELVEKDYKLLFEEIKTAKILTKI